jgi:hypothetical protein
MKRDPTFKFDLIDNKLLFFLNNIEEGKCFIGAKKCGVFTNFGGDLMLVTQTNFEDGRNIRGVVLWLIPSTIKEC